MAFKFTPKYIQIWLLISSLVVIYDAAYVLLRPDSMKGGSLFKYFLVKLSLDFHNILRIIYEFKQW
jgi:hypothetical protein